MARLKGLGGMPKEILSNQEILDLMLPTLRADLSLLESYRYDADRPLSCPIIASGGEQDPLAVQEQIVAWKEHTSAGFHIRMFPGDHFYFREVQRDLLSEIGRACDPNDAPVNDD